LRSISPRVIWPGLQADHSPPTIAEDKNTWIYISTPPYAIGTTLEAASKEQVVTKAWEFADISEERISSLCRVEVPRNKVANVGYHFTEISEECLACICRV
jgi:hypothetical protein